MPKSGKDIAGKIVDLLREKGGETEIGLIGVAKKFDSHPGTASHILKRLIECGIIKKTAEPDLTGTKRPARYALDERFKEGDSWREALKRKPSRQPTPAEVASEEPCSEGCLRARKILLVELVEVHERLKTCQEENRALRTTETDLQKRIEDLEGEAKSRGNACHQLRSDVEQLQSRLLTLRAQTSKPPSPRAAKKLMIDGSGVVILPGERLPDTR